MRNIFLTVLFFLLLFLTGSPSAAFAQCKTLGQVCTTSNTSLGNCCANSDIYCPTAGSSSTSTCQNALPLTFTCQGLPDPVQVNQAVTWSIVNNTYTWDSATIQFTGTDGLSDTLSRNSSQGGNTPVSTSRNYSTTGTKSASVTMTTNLGQTRTATCSIQVVNVLPTNTPAPTATPTPTSTTTTTTPSGGGICGVGEPNITIEVFAGKFFGCGVGLVGGVAMLFIIYGGFLLMLSAGDPGRVRMGKEYITYAVAGLLLAILTLVIIQVIGVDILRIPGLGT